MKKLVIGMLAHVDAGKTTLSESILYTSGAIRKLGRVDNKDAFLDNNDYERQRGITIFSKQAVFTYKDLDVTLLDTPGHVDFSAEMERTLWVLDYAVLVINGMDGVQGHTETLWGLLKRLKVPVFIFVNKMDQQGTDKHRILEQLKNKLSSGCVDFDRLDYEELAVCNEEALEQVLDEGIVDDKLIGNMISQREVFPVIFGSALRLDGVDRLLDIMNKYCEVSEMVMISSRICQQEYIKYQEMTGVKGLHTLRLQAEALKLNSLLMVRRLTRSEYIQVRSTLR